MKRIQQGFTLIELMIVVAIVGILAAIALPAYQDYVVRSKMSEPVAAIAACKTSVSEYYSTKGTLPDTANAGCQTLTTQFMSTLTVAAGVITATSQNTGATPANCTLTMTPSGMTSNSIPTWTGSTSCAARFVPSSFR
ncbi:MAG: pilin [Burkholderiales bacterium]|nr:pilin [Burkholderiales bacterium]